MQIEAAGGESLAGQVALVVEGDPQVAAAICDGLAAAGCAVVRAGAGLGAPRCASDPLTEVRADVTDVASTEAMARMVTDEFGHIDVLVNGGSNGVSAGRGDFTEIATADWDRCFSQIVRGMWLCCRAVAPGMMRRRSGRIVNIGSTAAWTGAPGFLHYATATSALIGATRSLARELGDFGVSVNMVCLDPEPAVPISRRTADPLSEFEIGRPSLPEPPAPGAIAGPVLFLAGADSDFITGQSYLVNGGGWIQ